MEDGKITFHHSDTDSDICDIRPKYSKDTTFTKFCQLLSQKGFKLNKSDKLHIYHCLKQYYPEIESDDPIETLSEHDNSDSQDIACFGSDKSPSKTAELKELVKSLREGSGFHKKKCEKEENILTKCVYCKYYLTAQTYGPLLQEYLKKIYDIDNPIDHLSGDGTKNGKNIEIKVSLGDAKGQLNIVQIRPDHQIDYYMILLYNMFEEEYGRVYLLILPSQELYDLVPTYGGYAHGTSTKNGTITQDNMVGHGYEYALRPNPTRKNTKPFKLWNILTSKWNRLGYNMDDIIC